MNEYVIGMLTAEATRLDKKIEDQAKFLEDSIAYSEQHRAAIAMNQARLDEIEDAIQTLRAGL